MLDFIERKEEPRHAMQSQAAQPAPESASPQWSNRILIAAMIGILFLTCFPFHFVLHAKLPAGASPFLLGRTLGKHSRAFDDFLNVLLFVPFGFGLSEKLLEKRKSRTMTFFVVWIAGILLSYAIEFTQLHIPGRDSGWEDVLTNSTGSAVGFFLFAVLGSALLGGLVQIERAIESFATIRGMAVLLLIYFSCWFAVSARLQEETRLANWQPDSRLVVGNDGSGAAYTAWKGEVSELEIWDRALPREMALALTGGATSHTNAAAAPKALAAYDFSGGSPFRDRMKSLPDLSWSPGAQAQGDPNELMFDGSAWLDSVAPASGLVADLRRTNQFAMHVVCEPAESSGYGRIISISGPPGLGNLTVWQENVGLAFWFRSPLSARHAQLTWNIPNALEPNQARSVVYSYDGANLSVYMDGKAVGPVFRQGPGAALARVVRHIRPNELDGYRDVYYALVFFPAGAMLGIFARGARGQRAGAWALFIFFFLAIVPVFFEYVLIGVSGRAFSAGNIILSVALLAGGALWINADGARQRRVPAE